MVKSIAIIGAGASGAAAAAALQAEDHFPKIRIFERRGTPGGTWIYDADPGTLPLSPGLLPPQYDKPLKIPSNLPTTTKPNRQNRFATTPVYQNLTTNVPDVAMSFTDLPFPYGPFVPHHIPKQYIESYFAWHRTDSLLCLDTTVEDLVSLPQNRWNLTLRRHDASRGVDEWWEEEYDAVVLANGHYSVPYIPAVPGLEGWMQKFPGRVEHSKTYRTAKAYRGLKVVVVGNSASGCDVVRELVLDENVARPIYNSRRSRGRCDGDAPVEGVVWKPVIERFEADGTIVFVDGSVLGGVDRVVYCTGYKASYPFWNEEKNGRALYDYESDRIIKNYQHTFAQDFPTLAFIGFPRVLTFRSFEYQAIAVARLWSGRNAKTLPPLSEQQDWVNHRAKRTKSEGRKFHQIEWDNGETMEWFRWLFGFSGLPLIEGHGRCPPVLGAPTRWAIEHIKKYPNHSGSACGEARSSDDESPWEMVEPHAGTLSFV